MSIRWIIPIMIAAATLGLTGMAQDTPRKSRQELEIMRGILGTTINFIVEEHQRSSGEEERLFETRAWRYSNIGAFYLRGQGAVFVIPLSDLRFRLRSQLEELRLAQQFQQQAYEQAMDYASLQQEQIEVQRDRLERMARDLEERKKAGEKSVAPVPPIPPEPPPVPPEQKENVRKALQEAQERIKERRLQSERQQQEYRELLAQLRVHLVEVLANHGDSLTHVEPDEYINIVLTSSGGGDFVIGEPLGGNEENPTQEILSVQKSWIREYKAGNLTLEAFRQKVLQYND